MKIQLIIYLFVLLLGFGCSSSSKISRENKKIKKQIEIVVKDKLGSGYKIVFSSSEEFILTKNTTEKGVKKFITVLVFNRELEEIYASKGEFNKAYWKEDMLILEKVLGQVKPENNQINKRSSENRVIYYFNPETKLLESKEVNSGQEI